MRKLASITLATVAAALSGVLPASASDSLATAMNALHTIQRDAAAISAGRYATKSQLQSPAREIALAWSKAARDLGNDGGVRVELNITNDSIAKLEKDWTDTGKARVDGKEITSTVGDLIEAAKSNGSS